jgi:hypothetical protein
MSLMLACAHTPPFPKPLHSKATSELKATSESKTTSEFRDSGILDLQDSQLSPFRREPASFLESCREVFAKLLRASSPDVFSSDTATAALRSKLLHFHNIYRGVTLHEELVYVVLTEHFSLEELRLLFVERVNGVERFISGDRIYQRLSELLGSLDLSYTIGSQLTDTARFVDSQYARLSASERGEKIWKKIEEKFLRLASYPKAQRQKLLEDIEWRLKMKVLDDELNQPRLFDLKIESSQVIFPNGSRYPVLKRYSDGTLVVGVPHQFVMRTQVYLNSEIVARYRSDSKLKTMVFEGTWMPDGRVMIIDQHHRTAAYQSVFRDPIPFILKPDKDGVYRSTSYLYPMKFYTSWSVIPDKEKLELLEKIQRLRARRDLSLEEQDKTILRWSEDLYLKSLRLESTLKTP